MGINDVFSSSFNRTLDIAGTQVGLSYFTLSNGSVWDDETTYSQSGNTLWVSGIVQSLNNKEGSEDAVLLEQGKLQNKDKKLYVNGSVSFNESNLAVQVQIGSGGEIYTTIPEGAITKEISGEKIYKRQFIRLLQTGSF